MPTISRGTPEAVRRWRARGPLFACLVAAAACTQRPVAALCGPAASGQWAELIQQHQLRYPDWELADAFKLLHQAAMGSEHAVPDTLLPTRWMRREWATMGDGPLEPLVDTLGAGGTFVRIHLRAWRAAGGSPDSLTAAFIATAATFDPDTAQLRCAVDALTSLARAGSLPWRSGRVAAEARAWAARGYPAVEHSPRFEMEYRPAYRVVALPLVRELLTRGKVTESPARPSIRRVPRPIRRRPLIGQVAAR